VINAKHSTSLVGGGDHAVNFFYRYRGWLFHHHVNTGLQRAYRDLGVGMRRRQDVDDVEFFRREHRTRIGVSSLHVKTIGEIISGTKIGIGYRDNVGTGFANVGYVYSRDDAGSYQADPGAGRSLH
jgi:hypothetical protein